MKTTFNLTKYGYKFRITVDEKHRYVYGIFNDIDGVTYKTTARCAPDDTFDEETGIAMVIRRLINMHLGEIITQGKRTLTSLQNKQRNINDAITKKYKLAERTKHE